MNGKYIKLENDLIKKYNANIVTNSKCWSRTHAHCDKTRRICKWKQQNSVRSLMTLAHEIGHLETFKSTMRRCESEYYATQWAIDTLAQLGIDIPLKLIYYYQRYINQEHARGIRRKGNLPKLETLQLTMLLM